MTEKNKPNFIPIDQIPPKGYIRVFLAEEEGKGKYYWVDPAELDLDVIPPWTTELTEIHKDRISKVAWALREHDHHPLDIWFHNFSRDQNPDKEIRMYEVTVAVYRKELSLRPGANPQERALVYDALMACMTIGNDIGNIISAKPQLKSLRHLDRIVRTWGEFWRGITTDGNHQTSGV